MGETTPSAAPLLGRLLRDVSRSFYLTLRVLPAAIRPQISLAYLLARAADTIADTDLLPVELRLNALAALRSRILGPSPAVADFGLLAANQSANAEQVLLERTGEAIAVLERFGDEDRRQIRRVLEIIISGQELDLRRFSGQPTGPVGALRTEEELNDYTYRVAGCVGEFWTRMCRKNLFPKAPLDDRWLEANGVRFGQGLQLVNILRDLPADLRKGRCYIPEVMLAAVGLAPVDLLDPENEPRFRPIYNGWLDRAQANLTAGGEYTLALPWSAVRVRLACAWPLLIGAKTLERLRRRRVLDATQRIKVTRKEIRSLMLRSVYLYPWPSAWRRLIEEHSRGN